MLRCVVCAGVIQVCVSAIEQDLLFKILLMLQLGVGSNDNQNDYLKHDKNTFIRSKS